MKKILVTCGNGCGSSLIVEMKIKSLMQKNNKEAEIDHCDLASAKIQNADIYIGSKELIEQLEHEDKVKIGLLNILDEEEITEKLINII